MPVQRTTTARSDVAGLTMSTAWTVAHVAAIPLTPRPEAPLIGDQDALPLLADHWLWDVWPVQLDDGRVAEVLGGSLWAILAAPRGPDPDARHDLARIRIVFRKDGAWRDCGNLLPDGFSPGGREWSGSTRFDPVSGRITLWFTAAGRRGQVITDFEQRLFHATGQIDLSGAHPAITGWSGLSESVCNDGAHYADLRTNQGVPGRIKGFRDPYWFRDPADGQGYLIFTGSKPASSSQSDYDGVIGLAAAQDRDGISEFKVLPPIIDADGLANELERPHMIVRDGLYYVFWSSQQGVFAPDGPAGPTALYGMVGRSVFGPFEPLNGTGLVVANPASEPRQAYAWQVLPSLDVVSFVDYWGLKGRDIVTDTALKAVQFGGTVAPIIRIAIEGSCTRIISDNER
jgi:levansucrase